MRFLPSKWLGLLLLLVTVMLAQPLRAQDEFSQHAVLPGDTWTALAWRYEVSQEALQSANPHLNRQRQPAIGTTMQIPSANPPRPGQMQRSGDGNLLATAVQFNQNPWQIALQNELPSPYRPLLYQPIFIPGAGTPQDLPPGLTTLEVSQPQAQPGQAVGLRGTLTRPISVTAVLDGNPLDVFTQGTHLVALTGTGAFFGTAQPELTLKTADSPLWSQPWQFVDKPDWIYQQLTLTGAAAEIDQASIEAERERLFALWEQDSPTPQWQAPFQLPIDNFLEISSTFGARRSYNGGPYRSYHEGVDFSAYGGTPVMAPAAGTVILAEVLYVRGGAVIINHGLGIYSGVYHLSSIAVTPGEIVQPGQLVGEVGTTGLSTGNHLHWDLLVDAVWVDAQAWMEQDMACWILVGMGETCG